MELQHGDETFFFLFSNELGNCFRETAVYLSADHVTTSMGLTCRQCTEFKNLVMPSLLFPMRKEGEMD